MFRIKNNQRKFSLIKMMRKKILYSVMFLALISTSALAGSSHQVTSILDKCIDMLTGNIAKAFAGIVVICIGYNTICTQEFSKTTLFITVGGFVLVFCAATLVSAVI